MSQFRVLVADDLSPEGVEVLKARPELEVQVRHGLKGNDLLEAVRGSDAVVVRSATKITAEVLGAGERLRVVGRAGVGVDNVDLAAATRRGVVVMNTPGGSNVTVAELTMAHLLGLARHLPGASASVKAGKWEKKKFQGHELFGKVLGVVGLGNIGAVVVERALAFGMKVAAYDPFITQEAAAQLGVELVTLDELWSRADAISLHVPLTEKTRNLVNDAALARMKKGVLIVNCARGGIIDEDALGRALASGQVGGAALDVFAEEPPRKDHPLFALDNFVATPHLGASTEEAQTAVSVAIAEQVVDFLLHGTVKNAVNMPPLSREILAVLGPFLSLGEKLGSLAAQIGPASVSQIAVDYHGEILDYPLQHITAAALKGLLRQAMDVPVNEVNAQSLARERGMRITESKSKLAVDFASLVSLTVSGPSGSLTVAGTVFGKRDQRLVRIDAFDLDAVPEGDMLIIENEDVPRVVGRVGTLLGDANVNIARIALSRDPAHGRAVQLINIDSPAPDPVLAALRATPHVLAVKQVRL